MLLSEHRFNSAIPMHVTEEAPQKSSVHYTRHKSVKKDSLQQERDHNLPEVHFPPKGHWEQWKNMASLIWNTS